MYKVRQKSTGLLYSANMMHYTQTYRGRLECGGRVATVGTFAVRMSQFLCPHITHTNMYISPAPI